MNQPLDTARSGLTSRLTTPAANFEQKQAFAHALPVLIAIVSGVVKEIPGAPVLAGNETGPGVVRPGRQTRAFVDALGRLAQCLAQACEGVALMAAARPLALECRP
ncbi:MAG: adenosylcobinamide-phosphate guanylyltransferase [Polaromonas sp.]|nr:adenosylcobinamide-phosphate guanylyltransferase [Polaromonas sp.]